VSDALAILGEISVSRDPDGDGVIISFPDMLPIALDAKTAIPLAVAILMWLDPEGRRFVFEEPRR
jgi:hypothetical protein